MTETEGSKFGGYRENLDHIQQAKVSADSFWQAAAIRDVASGLDLHPLIVGMVFELPWESSGKAHWTRSDFERWMHVLSECLHLVYDIEPQAESAEAVTPGENPQWDRFEALLTKLVDVPKVQVDQARREESEPADEAFHARDERPFHERISPGLSVFELRAASIELARSKKDAAEIMGYELSGDAVRRNRKAREWSQKDLAMAAGVHEHAIDRAERGEQVQHWQAARIASAFVLTEDDEEPETETGGA